MTTRTRKTLFIDALRNSGVVAAALQASGLKRRTAYHWRQHDPAFAAEWDEALDHALDTVEAAVMRLAIVDHDPQTARWILSRRRPHVWGDKTQLEVTGAGGGPVKMEQTVHLPDAETWAEIVRIREEQERDNGDTG